MQISNNLLNLTIYKSQCKALENTTSVSETTESVSESESLNTSEISVQSTGTSHVSQSMLVADIKAAIYNYSHPSVTGVTTTYGVKFDDICKTLGIGPNSTITKSDLTKLTRDDSKEDSNHDFCGALNRAFSYLKPTDTISYNDLMLFFMRGSGGDGNLNFSEYKSIVNEYSDIVQKQYDACTTPQEKLEFALEKTRDYLTESRMDLQLAALERLTDTVASENVSNPDTTTYPNAAVQVASVGQIAFADLGGWTDKGITLGSYGTTSYASDTYNYSKDSVSYTSDVIMWAGDKDYGFYSEEDGENWWNDGGITLNSQYYLSGSNNEWYKLVETFVHELTHATAYYYYVASGNSVSFSKRGFDLMLEKGLITQTQYDNISYSAEYVAMVNAMWDEWAAYTTSCNYWDSIAGDVFNSSDDLAVDGTKEKDAIDKHLVDTGYDSQDESGNWQQVVDPMAYFNWDYDKLQNMFYFA